MKAQVIKPTNPNTVETEAHYLSVFLAGSIENGTAPDWKKEITEELADCPITIYNPRRDNWNPNIVQSETNPEFNYQVNWELNRLDLADIIFMYFSPTTTSPITLLELGAYKESKKIIVCCPDGYYRKGNVEVVCSREGIPLFNDLSQATASLKSKISNLL